MRQRLAEDLCCVLQVLQHVHLQLLLIQGGVVRVLHHVALRGW